MNDLGETEVLLVDCQATGSSPSSAHLLELGWCRYRPSTSPDDVSNLDVTARLIRPPSDVSVPNRVRRLTGITQEMVENGTKPERVLSEFEDIQRNAGTPTAHYARFERSFLASASREQSDGDVALNLSFYCTYEIARRLFPGLPRKSLRAVAGFAGFSPPEKKRVTHHLRATAVIWDRIVEELRSVEDVHTTEQLEKWLLRTDPGDREQTTVPMDRDERLSLPEQPGVYHLEDGGGEVVYVGKATCLRDRVNTYFQSGSSLSLKNRELVSQVHDVSCRLTETPLEAALLESDQIKEHDPEYNRALRNRRRSIWFASEDGSRFTRSEPDPDHPYGPLSGRRPVEVLRSLRRGMNGGTDLAAVSNRAVNELLEEPAWEEGLALFRRRVSGTVQDPGLEHFLVLGLQFQAENQRESEEDQSGDGETDEEEEPLSPEQVADRIRSMIRRSTRRLRRGAWIRRIYSSVVLWKPDSGTEGDREPWRCIEITEGEWEREGEWMSEPPPPEVLRRRVSDPDREQYSVLAFDRLRVLTSELRMLRRNDRPIRMLTRTGKALSGEAIDGFLRWI